MCTPNFYSPKLYQTMYGQNNLLSRLPLHSHPIYRNHVAFSWNLHHPLIEITLPSLRICAIIRRNHIAFSQNFPHHSQKSHCILLEFPHHSQKSRCLLLEFAPSIRRNCVMHSYNLHHSIVYCCHYFRAIALPPNIILLPILSLFILC